MIPGDLDRCLQHAAVQWNLPLNLLRAMVLVESSGRWSATRYENGWRYWFGKITSNRERIGQATSWGPLQIMGAVAREIGFVGQFDELLRGPGIYWGCKKIRQLVDRHLLRWGWDGVIRAYNTGRPQPTPCGEIYLAKVKREMA